MQTTQSSSMEQGLPNDLVAKPRIWSNIQNKSKYGNQINANTRKQFENNQLMKILKEYKYLRTKTKNINIELIKERKIFMTIKYTIL